jgi:general secretion pathway protein L
MAISPTSIKHTVSAFLSWWLRELEAMWRPFSALGQRKPPTLTITAEDQKWIVSLQKGGRVKELGHVAIGSHPDAAKKALGTIVKSVKLRHVDLKILLPQHRALRKVLEMPSVTEPDLRQALSFEIDRQTPFQPEDVYFDYRILARHPEAKRLIVELTTVPRVIVEEVLKQIHGWGLQPSVVDVSANDGGKGLGINLLKASDEESRQKQSPLATALALILVLLLAAVFYVPVRQLAALDESLAAQVANEKETAKQTITVRDELDQTIKAARFLDERKNAVPSALLVLNELTKALPDNTWLLTFNQNNTEVKISGYSSAAAELISAIDAVSLFTKPAFTSPIVQDPQQKLERFEIVFNIDVNGVAKK